MTNEEIEKILLHELENVRAGREVWDGIEIKLHGTDRWTKCEQTPGFRTDKYAYRIKPKTIWVNGVEVPAPETKEPNSGTTFYIPCIYNTGIPFQLSWRGDMQECEYLKAGIIYINKEDAIARAKAMLLTQEVE